MNAHITKALINELVNKLNDIHYNTTIQVEYSVNHPSNYMLIKLGYPNEYLNDKDLFYSKMISFDELDLFEQFIDTMIDINNFSIKYSIIGI